MRLPNIPGYFDPTHPIYHSDFYQPETWQEWRDWQQRKNSQPNPSQRYQAVADFNVGKFSIEALKSAHYQMLAKKYELLRRSLPTWQSPSQEQFFTSFGKETSSKSGSRPSMDRNRFQGGKGRMGEQPREGQFREERQTLGQRRGQQQLTLPKLQELHTLPRQPIRGPIHRREHKITQQVKEKVKDFHDLVDTMMWTVDQDRELRMYFTKERLIKQLVDDPALKDTLQALIYESRALSQQLNGGETKNVLASIREQRGSVAGVRNHGVVSSRKKRTQSIQTEEMHPKRINANATPGKATRNLPPTSERDKSENLRDLGLFMESGIKDHDASI